MNDSRPRPTPVTLLTGFLGSGKTTLLNRILTGGHGIRFGVLVNDFGDVNVDARLVASMGGGQMDLSNGCVCCTMRGNLVTSLQMMLGAQGPPEHVVIEASGIADPLGILSAVRSPLIRDLVYLDGVVTVVDAENARNPRFDPQVVADQIRAADIVLLNKVDLVSAESVRAVRDWLHEIVSDVPVLEAVRAEVPLEAIMGLGDERAAPSVEASGVPHALVSWVYEIARPLAYRRVRAALDALPESIIRAKGILYLADAPNLRFAGHRVGRRTTIDVVGPWDAEPATALILLGEPGSMTVRDLLRRFDACVTDAIPLLPHENFARARSRSARFRPTAVP